MKLSSYASRDCWIIGLTGLALIAVVCALKWWWVIIPIVIVTLCLLAFYRDPERDTPVRRNVMISPADGVISSVHELEHFELFGEGASVIRIFLSVLDVHVNRSPCHGMVGPIVSKPGKYLNAMRPESAEQNAWTMFPLLHATKKTPVAAVRQVAGMIARTIVCAAKEGDILQRGERFGIIKMGSTAEVYVPKSHAPKVLIQKGQRVWGGVTEIFEVTPPGQQEGDKQ